MIFGRVDHWLQDKLPQFIYDPLIGCLICMASVHGVAWSLVLLPHTLNLFWQIPLVCVATAAMNSILNNIYNVRL